MNNKYGDYEKDFVNLDDFYTKDEVIKMILDEQEKCIDACFDTFVGMQIEAQTITNIIQNGPATVVQWADHTRTVAICDPEDQYSKFVGLNICLAKKAIGNAAWRQLMEGEGILDEEDPAELEFVELVEVEDVEMEDERTAMLAGLTKAELISFAEENNVKVDKSARKGVILDQIMNGGR